MEKHIISHRKLGNLACIVSHIAGKFPSVRLTIQPVDGSALDFEIKLCGDTLNYRCPSLPTANEWLAEYIRFNEDW